MLSHRTRRVNQLNLVAKRRRVLTDAARHRMIRRSTSSDSGGPVAVLGRLTVRAAAGSQPRWCQKPQPVSRAPRGALASLVALRHGDLCARLRLLLRLLCLIRFRVANSAALIVEPGFVVVCRRGWLRLLAHADRVAARHPDPNEILVGMPLPTPRKEGKPRYTIRWLCDPRLRCFSAALDCRRAALMPSNRNGTASAAWPVETATSTPSADAAGTCRSGDRSSRDRCPVGGARPARVRAPSRRRGRTIGFIQCNARWCRRLAEPLPFSRTPW